MERFKVDDGYLFVLEEIGNFSPLKLPRKLQDEVFLQVKVNLQVVLRLDAKLEVIWSKNEQNR